MSAQTAISWTDATFNGWWGCTAISPGCDHCYAERFSKRVGVDWGPYAARRVFGDKHWTEPLKWNREPFFECALCGFRGTRREFDSPAKHLGCSSNTRPLIGNAMNPTRRRVFCFSMADVFDKDAPAGQRDRFFSLCEATPELDKLVLTKRVGNVARMVPEAWTRSWPRHVWLGISVVNQEEADRDIPKLLALPAAVRFLSCEPLLGRIDLRGKDAQGSALDPYENDRKVSWVIAGGESGGGARPMHVDWARSLRDQCVDAGVAFFMKQMGGARDKREGLDDLPEDLRLRRFP